MGGTTNNSSRTKPRLGPSCKQYNNTGSSDFGFSRKVEGFAPTPFLLIASADFFPIWLVTSLSKADTTAEQPK